MAFGYYFIKLLSYYEFLSEVNKAHVIAYMPLIFLPCTHTHIHMRALVHMHN